MTSWDNEPQPPQVVEPGATRPATGNAVWLIASTIGIVVGVLGSVFGDTALFKWARVAALLGFVLFASDFTLSNKHEIRLVRRWAAPAAVAAAWVVFVSAVADASGLDDG